MTRFLASTLLATVLASCAHTQAVAPPGPDETLIFVLREGSFVGGGSKMWIAVNDQTVAKLQNGRYAVVRTKAGAITLNLSSIGMVAAAIALDDRPGETVYIKWRFGENGFTELDAAAGQAFVADAKATDPIEAPLGNDERVDALLNLSRLGFDLMRPASREITPDSEHAVVTIFRRKENPQFQFGLWTEDRHIGTLAANQGIDVLLTPGEHYFLSGNVGTTLLKAQVEAGKHYFAVIDVGEFVFRVRIEPLTAREAAKRDKWLAKVERVALDTAAITPRVQERVAMVTAFVRSVTDKARAGQQDFTELKGEHAY